MPSYGKAVWVYFGASFLLHLAWELLQSPLFANHGSGWESFKSCVFATATGDMLFTLVIYLSIAAAFADLRWVSAQGWFSHPAPWTLSAIVGILLGLAFELWAVHVDKRWTYGGMPIIPVLGVGVTPILQMMLVPACTLLISCRYFKSERS